MADINNSSLPVGGKYETAPTTYVDGDHPPLLVDANGRLQVDIISGGASNASVVLDDSAYTPGTGSITVSGYMADETTPDSVDEGDVGVARMTLDRKQLMVLTDATTDANRLAIDASGDIGVTQSGTWNIATVTTLTGITNDVNIADGGNSITVDAVNLDIRDLAHATDSVSIGDGTETLNITAAGEAEVDIAAQSLTALKISATAAANGETNPIYVQVVEGAVSGTEVLSYDTSAAVAKDASDNHDYTVTGSSTLKLKRCMGSASGAQKIEVQAGPVAGLVTQAVQFTSAANLNWLAEFSGLVEVPDTSTGTVRIIRTNRDNQAMDVYSTIIGNEI